MNTTPSPNLNATPSVRDQRHAAAHALVELVARDDMPPIWNWEVRDDGLLRGQLGVNSDEREAIEKWRELLGGEVTVEPFGSHSPDRAQISVNGEYKGARVRIWDAIYIGHDELRELRGRLATLTGLSADAPTDDLLRALESVDLTHAERPSRRPTP